jgi:3-deoxy-7-phosphoheptulonate synthase
MYEEWQPESWKQFPALQQPPWPDIKSYDLILSKLKSLPALVFSGETRNLKEKLVEVNKGNSFILQAGNCAESFSECNGPEIHNYMRIMWAMTDILEKKSRKQVIKIGRIAGQYAKPRSSDLEIINEREFPVYRGDNVNSPEHDVDGRVPDPNRLLEGYYRSVATLNLIRAFEQGDYSDSIYKQDWFEFPYSEEIKKSEVFQRYVDRLSKVAVGNFDRSSGFFISHEALLLGYEEAFSRIDTTTRGYYNTSAHFLWVGDRTRMLDSAHIEYLRGIGNPIGIKIGPHYKSEEIIQIIRKLNPLNREGKIVLIVRFGKDRIADMIHDLIVNIRASGMNVIWMVDPMHGNTYTFKGKKVRHFDDIIAEIRTFFGICREYNLPPGGVHLEITSKLVTECIGGTHGVYSSDLERNYESKVDPRLNGAQAIELALELSKLI